MRFGFSRGEMCSVNPFPLLQTRLCAYWPVLMSIKIKPHLSGYCCRIFPSSCQSIYQATSSRGSWDGWMDQRWFTDLDITSIKSHSFKQNLEGNKGLTGAKKGGVGRKAQAFHTLPCVFLYVPLLSRVS